MKAAVYTKYGPPEVVQVKEVEKPVPKKNEMLIRIKASAVNAADWRIRKADPPFIRIIFGLFKPRRKILGAVFSGVVEETGKDVTRFKKGDAVFGSTGMRFGGHAEYICLSEKSDIIIKPETISHEEAAALPFGGVTALHYLEKAKIKEGDEVLIYGASGSSGSAAISLAVHSGAFVTGVCSGANAELVSSLGAKEVIDYTKEDFSAGGKKYDIIFDAVGKTTFSKCKKLLAPGGRFVTVNRGLARTTIKRLELLASLAAAGKPKPAIEKIYPLEQIVEAHRIAESGHKKGNLIISMT